MILPQQSFKITGAIFDLDGTLLDSMSMWTRIGDAYLQSIGIQPPENLWRTLKPLSLLQSAEYLKHTFALAQPIEQIMQGINRQIENSYFNTLQLKPGTAEFLHALAQHRIPMTIATATDRYCVEAALERTGIAHFFSAIKTCSEAGQGKRESALVFDQACKSLGTAKETTLIFEDAIHAIVTAKHAGYRVLAIADKESAEDEIPIRIAADYFAPSIADILPRLEFAGGNS